MAIDSSREKNLRKNLLILFSGNLFKGYLIYGICDDLLKILKKKEDIQSKMNFAEIMTIAITAALFFGANFSKARIF